MNLIILEEMLPASAYLKAFLVLLIVFIVGFALGSLFKVSRRWKD